MALNGSFGTNFGTSSMYRLQIEWKATQNISNNTSTVEAKVYLISRGSSYTINSSQSKSGTLTIDGNSASYSIVPSLSGNQKKLLDTHTRTVTHSNDGSKSITIASTYNIAVTLGGNYVSSVTTSQTVSLDTIPRASTMTNTTNWTGGDNKTISISRASSSFSHSVAVAVGNGTNWTTIKTIEFSTSETSKSTSFSTSEHNTMFSLFRNNGYTQTRMILTTKSGSTTIGTSTKTGTFHVTDASKPTITTGTVNIGSPVAITIARTKESFTHTVRFYSNNTLIKTLTGIGTSTTWTPTTAETTSWFNTAPTSNVATLKVEVDTYYSSTMIRSTTNTTKNANVTNSNPTFSANSISYADTNATTIAITGNNQHIIQSKSNLTAYVNTTATARNGATMVNYQVSVNGVSKTIASATTGNVSVGTVNSNSNIQMSITAVDSRGNKTTVSKTVTMIPYSAPLITPTSQRQDSILATTYIDIFGTFSPVTVGGTRKNNITRLRFRHKQVGTTTWSGYINATISMNGSTFTGARATVTLDNSKAFDVEVDCGDTLGSTTLTTFVVPAGQPIFFIDPAKRSLSMNTVPVNNNELRINGAGVFTGNLATSGTLTASGTASVGALNTTGNLSTKHVTATGLSVNGSTSIPYLELRRTDTSSPFIDFSNDASIDYDARIVLEGNDQLSFYGASVSMSNNLTVDGTLFTQGGRVGVQSSLWSGAVYMTNSHSITPSRQLNHCNLGWCLVWSDYDSSTNTTNNINFVFTFIPKQFTVSHAGQNILVAVPITKGLTANKTIYVSNTTITGHADNGSDTDQMDAVLRYVWEV